MAVNLIQDGKSFDVRLTADLASGALYEAGDVVGIAAAGGKDGSLVAIKVSGVWEVPKATGVGSGFVMGTKLYFDTAAGHLTETAGNLKFAGYAWKDTLDADTTCWVRLIG